MCIEYLLFLQNIRNSIGGAWDTFFILYSDFVYIICPMILFFLYWSYKKEYGICGFLSQGITRNINSLVKLCACIHRPWILDSRVQPSEAARKTASGYSFPSGHSSTAAGVFGVLAWLFRKHKWLAAILLLLIPMTMFARNFLGVHTLQDVLVACLSGLIGAFAAVQILKWEANGKNRDLIILAVAVVSVILILVFISYKSYPMVYADGKLLADPKKMMGGAWKDTGMLLGLIIGWIIEKRFIKFKIPDSWSIRIARYVPGIALYFFADHAIKKVLLQHFGRYAGSFAGNFIAFILFIAVYPLIFTAIEKCFKKDKE